MNSDKWLFTYVGPIPKKCPPRKQENFLTPMTPPIYFASPPAGLPPQSIAWSTTPCLLSHVPLPLHLIPSYSLENTSNMDIRMSLGRPQPPFILFLLPTTNYTQTSSPQTILYS